jgi:hypothetical protein
MVEWIFIELWIFIGLLIFFVTFFVFMIFFPFLVTREISCFLCSILFFSQGEPRQCNGVNYCDEGQIADWFRERF